MKLKGIPEHDENSFWRVDSGEDDLGGYIILNVNGIIEKIARNGSILVNYTGILCSTTLPCTFQIADFTGKHRIF